MEPHKSLNAIVDTLDTQTCILVVEYSSSPVRVSLTALYFVGFGNVACFPVFKIFLRLGLFFFRNWTRKPLGHVQIFR